MFQFENFSHHEVVFHLNFLFAMPLQPIARLASSLLLILLSSSLSLSHNLHRQSIYNQINLEFI